MLTLAADHVFCLKTCKNLRMTQIINITGFCFVIVYHSDLVRWGFFLRWCHEKMAIAWSYTFNTILWMICFMYIIYF